MMKKQKLRSSKANTAAEQQRPTRVVTEFDPNGIEVTHHRTVDTLALMLRSGAITGAMHAAGRDFQAAFTIACFDSMPRVNLNLMGRSPSPAHDVCHLSDRQLAARERVARAVDALGGHGSPAGSCVWHVVGMQRRCASGRSGRAGADGRSGRRARREFWSQRSVCWRSTSAFATPASGVAHENDPSTRSVCSWTHLNCDLLSALTLP
jgi:hypothetical protein